MEYLIIFGQNVYNCWRKLFLRFELVSCVGQALGHLPGLFNQTESIAFIRFPNRVTKNMLVNRFCSLLKYDNMTPSLEQGNKLLTTIGEVSFALQLSNEF